MDTNTIALILTALSAIGAAGAALAAWRSANQTRLASEGQLFSNLYAEYGDSDMLWALRLLRNWKAEKGDEFEFKWKKALDAGDKTAHGVDQARRHVKSYFMRAFRLHESGYVSKRFLCEVCSVDGINILYDIVERLEYAFNPAYDRSKFDRLRKICGRGGTKELIAPVPLSAIPDKKESA